jgi:predicted nucleotidyltransferase
VTTVRERNIAKVRDMVLATLAGRRAKVWLFGSCARGDWVHSSDIDLAIEAEEPLPAGLMADLTEALEESTIPYEVDVVDLAHADSKFRERVKKEGIPWTP